MYKRLQMLGRCAVFVGLLAATLARPTHGQSTQVNTLSSYVTVVTPGSASYGAVANEALGGPSAASHYGPLLPYSLVLINQAQQPIVAIAVDWQLTDPAGKTTHAITIRTLLAPGPSFTPRKAIVFAPDLGILGWPGSPDAMADPMLPSVLARFQKQSTVVATLDGIVLQSGQFVGPDTQGEFEQLSARLTAAPAIGRAVLSLQRQGTPVEQIAAWLQGQTQASSAQIAGTGSALLTRWANHYQTRAARLLLNIYAHQGSAGLMTAASSMASSKALSLFR